MSIPTTSSPNPESMDKAVLASTTNVPTTRSSCPCCIFWPDDGTNWLSPPLLAAAATTLDRASSKEPNKKVIASSSKDDVSLSTPKQSLEQIMASDNSSSSDEQRIVMVDTHGHPHLRGNSIDLYNCHIPEIDSTTTNNSTLDLLSITCAVSESDWNDTLSYASQSSRCLPALGIHPWYLEDLSSSYLTNLENLLLQHPSAIVGEIGLCKVAKFLRSYPEGKGAGLELQRRVFREQFQLAAKLRRPVTVHCVRSHGALMSVFREIREEGRKYISNKKTKRKNNKKAEDEKIELGESYSFFPPAIGMHSFGGTSHHIRELLEFEKETTEMITAECMTPPKFYFGFSHAINVAMCSSEKSRRQGLEAIRAVPSDRLMTESDVHSPNDVMAGTAGSVGYIASALQRPLNEVAKCTAANALCFLGRSSGARTNTGYIFDDI